MASLLRTSGASMRAIIIPVFGATKDDIILQPRFVRETISDWILRCLPGIFDERLEHVAVLYSGERRDMFVGETSSINGRHIRNMRATEIYRANAVSQMPPSYDPEELPAISGPAIIFPDCIVWT